MARLPESSPYYRTREEIAHDVAFVLNAPIKEGTKQAVLTNAAWVWTEFFGKIEGCPYWSQGAKLLRLASLRAEVNALKDELESPQTEQGTEQRAKRIKLIHEHAVPKNVVLKMLRVLNPATPELVYGICEQFLHGVVVTPQEDAQFRANRLHQRMPDEFNDSASPAYKNPWLRYVVCGIIVVPTPPDWPA